VRVDRRAEGDPDADLGVLVVEDVAPVAVAAIQLITVLRGVAFTPWPHAMFSPMIQSRPSRLA